MRTLAWWVGAAIGFAALTVAVTWPVLRHPATSVLDCESLYGPAAFLIQRDVNLTLWVLAWGAHALGTDPTRTLHGNAFHPTPWSLALSEHMLGNQPLFAPVYLATGNAVLGYQWTLLATFVLSGLTMAAWVGHHTHDRAAALAAGVLYAFSPFRLWQLGSLHVISTQWIPLVPLAIDLALEGRGRRGAVLLALALSLSTGCSYYTGYAAFALGATYAAVLAWTRPETRRRLGWLLAGAAVAVVVVAAVSLPYLLLQRDGIIPKRSGANFVSLAFLRLVFDGPLVVLAKYVRYRPDDIPLFLGWVTLALAAAGAGLWRRPPRGALLAGALVIYVLTLGPTLALFGRDYPLPYRVLAKVVPGFNAMRQPQRFALAMHFVAPALAGLALAALRALLRERGWRWAAVALPIAAAGVALVVGRTPPLRTVAMPVGDGMPEAQRWLAAHGDGGALLELPIADEPARRLFEESVAMYTSTAHWLPLVNGYSPYPPPTYNAVFRESRALPAPAAVAAVRAVVPVRWLLVHRDRLPPDTRARWDEGFAAAGLRRAADFGDTVVWEAPAGDGPRP